MTTAPLRLCSTVFLHIKDRLLTEEDEELPLAGHAISTLQHFHLIEDFVAGVFVGTQKVVINNPESQVIVGAVDVAEAVGMTVRGFISPVQTFNHLFERTVLGGNSIVVGKSNDLGDFKSEVFAKLLYEFHCGERIGAVSISNEPKILRQFREVPECHTHSEDTGADAAVIGDLIADDGTGGGVHDEPDVGFDTADFYVCLIGCEHLPFLVGILVNERFDADGGSFAVVGDLLVGDADIVKVFQSL